MTARLHKLYPSEIDAPDCSTVDIVLVHGLDGHYEDTWRARDKNGTLWPCHRDFLPAYLPNCRVLSWSYNATINGLRRIRDHALSLLVSLRDMREDENTPLRPLVFVGHSSGGVIIKQALRLAFNDAERYEFIAGSVCGVVFFATPHYGQEQDHWQQFVSDVITCRHASALGPSRKMRDDIKRQSEWLSNTTEDFMPLVIHRGLKVISFVEEHETEKLGRVIVDRDKGRLHHDGEEYDILSGDHHGICQFGEADRDHFKKVGRMLQRLVEASPVTKQVSDQHRKLLNSLCPERFHRYQLGFVPTPGTCSWIQEQPDFNKWRNHLAGSTRLWIDGELACGKTYLARYITANTVRDARTEVLQCFLNGSLPDRNTCVAILRSTIHQVFKAHPVLINKFAADKLDEAANADKVADIWTLDELSTLWVRIIPELVCAERRRVVVVIDGFDEIGDGEQDYFLTLFEQCDSNVRSSWHAASGSLHLLILSRPCASLENYKHKFLRYTIMAKDTSKDMLITVKKKLDVFAGYANYPPDFRNMVCKELVRGANGVYLWAMVMVADLEHRLPTRSELTEQLQSLPRTLAELYDSILGRIKRKWGGHYNTKAVFRWIAFRQETLRAEELNIGLAMAKIRDRHPNAVTEHDRLQDNLMPAAATKMVLYKLCGQLLRFSGDGIEPVHSSLSQYLTTPTEVLRREHPDWIIPFHQDFYLATEQSHVILGNICVAYLTMEYFADSGPPFDPRDDGPARWEDKIRTRVDRYAFARYAALCWSKHLSDAGYPSVTQHNSSADITRQQSLEDKNQHHTICWTEVWWLFRRWPRLPYPEDVSRLRLDDILFRPLRSKETKGKPLPGTPGTGAPTTPPAGCGVDTGEDSLPTPQPSGSAGSGQPPMRAALKWTAYLATPAADDRHRAPQAQSVVVVVDRYGMH
ncbi:hypothetical protein MFIFM68171_06743 [Madurella fahalii]|uniref:NACHT domain-containing protein n=1 Tax=Madurella fahalii TaxID=1157608 RepID=A0ABQ0GFJ3_9PEZI